jgi:hypothetical protein
LHEVDGQSEQDRHGHGEPASALRVREFENEQLDSFLNVYDTNVEAL